MDRMRMDAVDGEQVQVQSQKAAIVTPGYG
jgi:hypothetical protein